MNVKGGAALLQAIVARHRHARFSSASAVNGEPFRELQGKS